MHLQDATTTISSDEESQSKDKEVDERILQEAPDFQKRVGKGGSLRGARYFHRDQLDPRGDQGGGSKAGLGPGGGRPGEGVRALKKGKRVKRDRSVSTPHARQWEHVAGRHG